MSRIKSAELATEVWKRFSPLPGSEYIATRHAIHGLVRWIEIQRPQRILEIGTGIGTLTFAAVTALRHISPGLFEYIAIEENEFCRTELYANLGSLMKDVTLLSNINELPNSSKAFDLIMLDGGDVNPAYYRLVAAKGSVFVEGLRTDQRTVLESTCKDRTLAVCSYTPLSFSRRGGYWIYKFEPTVIDRMRLLPVQALQRLWGVVKYRLKSWMMKRK